MKKHLFMAVASMLMFTACSNNDVLPDTDGQQAKAVELSFDFTVNSGIQTRAGRPLYSSEALQQVNNLQLLVFKDGTYSSTINVAAFNNTTAVGTETKTYKFNPQLENGTYRFLAVGFEETTLSTYSMPTLIANTTTLDDVVLSLVDDKDADEVFSGLSTTYTVSNDTKSLTASVELNRVVAGVLGYFINIPYQVLKDGVMTQVKKVCVELSKKATAANLKDRTHKTSTTGAYKLLTIDLTGKDKADDGNYYINTAGTNPVTLANSFLAGGYSLPFVNTGAATMKVVLYDESDVALKTYPVVCSGGSDHGTGNATNFDVLANHFYSLGHKSADDSDNGPDPEQTPDPDKPIDLSKDQVITITVNAAWSVIHDLDLGEEI